MPSAESWQTRAITGSERLTVWGDALVPIQRRFESGTATIEAGSAVLHVSVPTKSLIGTQKRFKTFVFAPEFCRQFLAGTNLLTRVSDPRLGTRVQTRDTDIFLEDVSRWAWFSLKNNMMLQN